MIANIYGPKNKNHSNDSDDDNYEERRKRAEELGWDEEEMDLEEFEGYFE